ncbi:BrnA antitoxin family protein [Aurantimonas sp. VKM B-3413]|uniref:BrnA antitoxin family protein n=1 Tax=Aurantimonas sp. VKM B-3413 TaxID=2779401 RepID=UPI001E4706DD|nr:BrnA antitoxin family protein [Aurantimonas sp. VKM B-3413]MCB8838889.1 BrnA antitoxin family protein [Aurantimonas sp. VKM B-3413]
MKKPWLTEPISDEEDAEITAAALSDPDIPPLSDEDWARLRPAREVMPPEFFEPVTSPPRRFFMAEIELDVAEHFKREAGEDWQARINDILRAVIAKDAAE